MKKKLAAMTFVLVLVTASGAFAWGGYGTRGMYNPGMMNQGMMNQRMMASGAPGMVRGMAGRGMMGTAWASVEIPQEIRDKQVEMQKLRVDLINEMNKNPLDRAKVESLQKRNFELRDELSNWFMKQRLDMIEKLQK